MDLLSSCVNHVSDSKATAFIEDDLLYITCISRESDRLRLGGCKSFEIEVSRSTTLHERTCHSAISLSST